MTRVGAHVLVPYGWPIVVYLALAALAVGAALVAVALLLGRQRAEEATRIAGRRSLMVACGAIALGGVALIVDLEAPARFGLILRYANPASMIAWGARAITLFGLLTAVAWWALGRAPRASLGTGWRLLLGSIGLLAVFIGLYPGWFLDQATARPLWDGPLIAPLFLLSALHAGVAVALVVRLGAPGDGRSRHGSWETVLVIGQALLLGGYLVGIDPAHGAARDRMLTGALAPWLWGGVVIVGWLLPWLLARRADRSVVLLRAGAVMLGVIALRALLVWGGQGEAALIAGLEVQP